MADLFVSFIDEEYAQKQGFNPKFSYIVYHIDVTEDDQDERVTDCLLANQQGQFIWVSIDKLQRVRTRAKTESNRPFTYSPKVPSA